MYAVLLALFAWLSVAGAAPSDPDLPAELRDWVAWVEDDHPEWSCAVVDGRAACLWPGVLDVSVSDRAGAFRLDVRADRETRLPLPGGEGTWPQDLRVDGRPVPVLAHLGRPTITLPEGAHAVTWVVPWTTRPARIEMPPTIGVIALTVDGAPVARPERDDAGLRLGVSASSREDGDALRLDVHRKIVDHVPVRVETRLSLKVSGAPREEVLGRVGVPGTQPVTLSADLPARLDAEGRLVAQVRPGDFTITVVSLHEGPVDALEAPAVGGAWPEEETWVFAAQERIRAVQVSGAPGVDPSRTSLPADWRDLPAYRVSPGTPLRFETLRRGEPEPPPNRLQLSRALWLDHDGGGWTVQDRFNGVMHEGWRLDGVAPFEVGHVAVEGADRVITALDGRAGAELRRSFVGVLAESRVDDATRTLPAVGWDTEVSQLDTTVHLPPGFRLFWAWGADEVTGGAARWNLLELFFVVLVALAVRRLLDLRWAAVALLGVGLSLQELGAPMWTWVAVLVAFALERVLPEGWPRRIAGGARWLALAVLLVLLVPFAVQQIEGGLFPVLGEARSASFVGDLGAMDYGLALEAPREAMPEVVGSAEEDGDWEDGPAPGRPSPKLGSVRGGSVSQETLYTRIAKQQDAAAVVQTGPGVPSWDGHRVTLSWAGPVTPDVDVGFLIVGPLGNALLAFLRVILLVALAVRLMDPRRLDLSWLRGGATVGAALALATVASPARAAPDAELLQALATRLEDAPACRPDCVEVSALDLRVADDRLSVSATIHAEEAGSWVVPGPMRGWTPETVRRDGARVTALARRADGFLHVRVPAGVHEVVAEGPLPASGALALQLGGEGAQRVTWTGEGWSALGLAADGTVEGGLQLVRDAGGEDEDASTRLRPWVEIERVVDLGLPWVVRTTVRRLDRAEEPLGLRVPRLPGESIVDGGVSLEGDDVLVTLSADETERTWASTLDEADRLTLTAAEGVPWSEVWVVLCAPLHHCAIDGPPPLFHVRDGVWSPYYRPWPGESVSVDVSRPEAVAGRTVTIDRAQLDWRPGLRSGEGTLTLGVRTSQGGQQTLTLPEGARLQLAEVDGRVVPVPLRDGQVVLPLTPGSQELRVVWQQVLTPSFVQTVPALDVGAPAVNVEVTVHGTDGRWLVWLGGPRVGPVVLFWLHVVFVVGLAPLLARVPGAPLGVVSWALLLAGFAHLHVLVAAPVALTLVAFGVRSRWRPDHSAAFVFLQLGLVMAALVSVGCLYAAVHSGLLFEPEMQVAGNGSWSRRYVWFADRTGPELVQPWIVSTPMAVWRGLMLAWASWLAWSLVRWARWGWSALNHGGLLRPEPVPSVDGGPAEAP